MLYPTVVASCHHSKLMSSYNVYPLRDFNEATLYMYSTLRQEIEQERYHQKLFLDKRQCSCCEQPLGLIFNSGANCPNCVSLVCKQCRKAFSKPPPKFICTVCGKQRYVVLQLSKAGFKNFMVD